MPGNQNPHIMWLVVTNQPSMKANYKFDNQMFSLKFTFSKYSGNQAKSIPSEFWTIECFQKVMIKRFTEIKEHIVKDTSFKYFGGLSCWLAYQCHFFSWRNKECSEALENKERNNWTSAYVSLFLEWVGGHSFLCQYPIFILSVILSHPKDELRWLIESLYWDPYFFNVTAFNQIDWTVDFW